jgi:hypothetical protein
MSFISLASTVFPLVSVYSLPACLSLFLIFFCHLSGLALGFLVVILSGNNTPNDSEENERESIVTPEKQTSRKQRYITITPRKQAKYVSPPKRIVTRKPKANPDKWQKNIRKRLRQAGSEYTDTKGKTVEAREMKDIDGR